MILLYRECVTIGPTRYSKLSISGVLYGWVLLLFDDEEPLQGRATLCIHPCWVGLYFFCNIFEENRETEKFIMKE